MRTTLAAALTLATLLTCGPSAAQTPSLVVLSSNGIRAVLTELLPGFERLTSQRVAVTYSVSAELKRRIDEGAAFDVTILTPGLVDELIARGTLTRESRTPLARSGMALGVKAGAPKPDIRTTESLTRTLRGAASIAFAKEGAGGVFFAAVMPRLGLTEALAPKLRPFTAGTDVSAAIARGDAELGLLPLSELITAAGVDVVGPFPADIQGYAVMVGAIATRATQAAAAKRLLEYIAAAEATPTVVKHGMERMPRE